MKGGSFFALSHKLHNTQLINLSNLCRLISLLYPRRRVMYMVSHIGMANSRKPLRYRHYGQEGGHMEFVYSDGGRSKYYRAEKVGDCVTRAICNATGLDYQEVYKAINTRAKSERVRSHRGQKRSSSRDGVFKDTFKPYIESLGWVWHPTMTFGSGCKVHLRSDELPSGTLIVNVSKHLTCVKDGVLYDTYDCSRGGTRCVYGYWAKG